jgi:hypothetical protein
MSVRETDITDDAFNPKQLSEKMMPLEILTHPLFLAVAISFFLGSFGYILVRLWLQPVMRYRRAKRQIQLELKQLDATETETGFAKNMRLQADVLTSVYHGDLPYWYKLLLEKREEDPIKAATILMKLANTHNPDHARKQRDQITTYLKL